MKYREDRYKNPISALGFGCMRFPKNGLAVDMNETGREIMAAYEAGVNYFDTAYIYPGSEAALGEILARNNIRDKVNIADKLPHYLIKSRGSLDKYFDEHLRRLQTDRIDYYLMHMLNDVSTWDKLCEMGIREWIEEKKKSGQIRYIGFSYHGNTDRFKELVDAYDWDFCQIQYNYMDVSSQAGVEGLRYASSHGLAVIIMEPLRGGKLVTMLPDEARRLFDGNKKGYTPAQWAFSWLWNQPEVTCVLSGMNSMEMLRENVQTASETDVGEFTGEDEAFLQDVVSAINSKVKVGCTGCRYCMPCPHGVDIPGTFAAYNHCFTENKAAGRNDYLMTTAYRKNPTSASQCVKCGACETHCPQHIKIRDMLEEAKGTLETPGYKLFRAGIKVLGLYK